MADPSALAASILAALRTMPGITVYDGFVPTSVPMTGSYINPYVVLWLGAGGDPGELTSCGIWDEGTLILDFQTTTVGANPGICRAVDAAVKDKLLNLRVGTGRVRPNPDGFNQQSPILDTQVTPARFMLPRQLRLITN